MFPGDHLERGWVCWEAHPCEQEPTVLCVTQDALSLAWWSLGEWKLYQDTCSWLLLLVGFQAP